MRQSVAGRIFSTFVTPEILKVFRKYGKLTKLIPSKQSLPVMNKETYRKKLFALPGVNIPRLKKTGGLIITLVSQIYRSHQLLSDYPSGV